MDTISRENNSMLPVGAIIVGVIALLLGGYAAVTVAKVNKTVSEQQAKVEKIDAIENSANVAATAAEGVRKDLNARVREIQENFNLVGGKLAEFQGSILKLEESAKKPGPAAAKDGAKKGGGEPAVAGPGEYVVKPGDSGVKIANANGVSIGDLQAVNPGVNWNALKPGQKLKLPKK
jgi:LysM repeat protein